MNRWRAFWSGDFLPRRVDSFDIVIAACCVVLLFSALLIVIRGQSVFSQTRVDLTHQGKNPPPSPIEILVNGQPVGQRGTVNFKGGSGFVASCADNPASNWVDCTFDANTASMLNKSQFYQDPLFCDSANGTSAYTCSLKQMKLASYSVGMFVLLRVDTPCTSGCSLNIDGAGLVSIKGQDGLTNPSSTDLLAGRVRWIWYDGSVFRLL
jgi:hypothetical protein